MTLYILKFLFVILLNSITTDADDVYTNVAFQ